MITVAKIIMSIANVGKDGEKLDKSYLPGADRIVKWYKHSEI